MRPLFYCYCIQCVEQNKISMFENYESCYTLHTVHMVVDMVVHMLDIVLQWLYQIKIHLFKTILLKIYEYVKTIEFYTCFLHITKFEYHDTCSHFFLLLCDLDEYHRIRLHRKQFYVHHTIFKIVFCNLF